MKPVLTKKLILIFILPFLFIFLGCENPFQSKDKGEYKIAFDIRNSTKSVKDIYLMNADGEDRIQLTQRPTDIDEESYYWSANPVWSPDGNKIMYKSYQNGKTNLYTITPDGSELTQVTDFPDNESVDKFAWSPNGNMIAVVSDSGIYTINNSGGNREQITDKPIWDLSWSSDGSKIVFTTFVLSEDSTSNMGVIHVVNADGTNLKQLTTKEENGRFPSWIPNDNTIVWTGGEWGENSIYIMNTNGGEHEELISDYTITGLSVSPDGNRIAFLHYVALYVHDLYVMDIAGKGLSKLNPENITMDGCGSLSWSPDGESIMVECGYNTDIHPDEYGIYKVKPDGSEWSFLGKGDNPSWSPIRIH